MIATPARTVPAVDASSPPPDPISEVFRSERMPSAETAQTGGCPAMRRRVRSTSRAIVMGGCANIACGIVKHEVLEMHELAVDPQ